MGLLKKISGRGPDKGKGESEPHGLWVRESSRARFSVADASVAEASSSSQNRSSIRFVEPSTAKTSSMARMALRAEKRMAGVALTSDLGQKVIREYCGPETFLLLDAMKVVVDADPSLPAGAGTQMRNACLRIAGKVALLHKHQVLLHGDFIPSSRLSYDVGMDIIRKIDRTREPPHRDVCDPTHTSVVEQFNSLTRMVTQLITPHVSSKNVKLAQSVLRYFSAATFERVLTDRTLTAAVEDIYKALNLMHI